MQSTIQPRMANPVMVIPAALAALQALSKSAAHDDVSPITRALIQLRASQVNGCSLCVEMHSRELKQAGEADERVFAVAAWRESPHFSDAERAVLALTEAATRLSDRADPVPEEIWEEASRHYAESALAAVVIEIAAINAWNRINVTTRQLGGSA